MTLLTRPASRNAEHHFTGWAVLGMLFLMQFTQCLVLTIVALFAVNSACSYLLTVQYRKTQIALAYTYQVRESLPEVSVFGVQANTVALFTQAYASIARECQIPDHDKPDTDVLSLVKTWLQNKKSGR